MKTFEDVISRVRQALGGTGTEHLWPDDELSEYFDEGQREYCEVTYELRSQVPVTLRENQETYTLPSDCIAVLRMENTDGSAIEARASEQIANRHGLQWRGHEGTMPRFHYSDLDGPGSFRLYPRPCPTQQSSTLATSAHILQLFDISFFGGAIKAMDVFDGLLYVATSTRLFVIDESGEIIKTVVFSGFAIDYAGAYLRVGLVDGATVIYVCDSGAGVFFGSIYSVNLDTGTTTLFRTNVTGRINHMFPLNVPDGFGVFYILCEISGGLYQVFGGAVIEILAYSSYGTVLGSVLSPDPTFGYLAVTATRGLVNHYDTGTNGGVIDATASFGICTDGSTVYYNANGNVKSYDYTSPTPVDTTLNSIIPSITYPTGLACDSTHLYIQQLSAIQKCLISDLSSVGTYYFYDIGDPRMSDTGMQVFNGSLHVLALYQSTGLLGEFPDEGAVVYIDGNAADDERGAVVDMVTDDCDSIIIFESEEGAIIQIVTEEEQITLWYAREPVSQKLEIAEPRALEYYMLFKCFEKDFEMKNEAKSQLYMEKFSRITGRGQEKAMRGYNRSTRGTKSYHY